MSELPEDFQNMSDRDMAQQSVLLWGMTMGLSGPELQKYVDSATEAIDLFTEFDLHLGISDASSELIESRTDTEAMLSVINYVKFLSSVASAMPASNFKAKMDLFSLAATMTKASIIWAYLYGYRAGQRDDINTDVFDDFVSTLDD